MFGAQSNRGHIAHIETREGSVPPYTIADLLLGDWLPGSSLASPPQFVMIDNDVLGDIFAIVFDGLSAGTTEERALNWPLAEAFLLASVVPGDSPWNRGASTPRPNAVSHWNGNVLVLRRSEVSGGGIGDFSEMQNDYEETAAATAR